MQLEPAESGAGENMNEVFVSIEKTRVPALSGAGENINEVFGSIEKARVRLSTPDLQFDPRFSHIGLTPLNSGDSNTLKLYN